MKRLLLIIIAGITLTATSCYNDGNGTKTNKLLSLLGLAGNSGTDTAPDNSSIKYMQYMYDDANGQALDQKVTKGPVYNLYQNEIQNNLNEYLKQPFIENMDPASVNTGAANWWERINVDPDKVGEYLTTPEGQQTLGNADSEATGPSSNMNPPSASSMTGLKKAIKMPNRPEILELMRLVNNNNTYNYYNYNYTINYNLDINGVVSRLNTMSAKLTTIQSNLLNIESDLHGITDTLQQIQVRDAGLKLQDAKDSVNGFLVEASNLQNVDNAYRRNLIRDYILTGYEEMYIAAYNSAVEKTNVINQVLTGTNRVPFNMLFSDMVFMYEMSMLRINFAGIAMRADQQLQYRARVAREDLKRLKEIKDSIDNRYNKGIDKELMVEAYSLVLVWETVLRAHIEVVYGPWKVNAVPLEDAANYSNGSGSFGTRGNNIDIGQVLRDSSGFFVLDPIAYDQPLTSIFDTMTSGNLASGKYLRMLVDGRNVMDPDKLNLTPVAKSFASGLIAPPKNQVYIDPASGQFILPRPSYWSKCEDPYAGLSNPEISEPNLVISKGGDFWSSPGVGFFNNGIAVSSNNPNYNYSYIWIKPYGTSGYSNKGTASFWAKRIWGADPEGNSYATIQFNIGSIMIKINKSASSGEYLSIEKEGNLITKWTGLNWSEYTHFYIVWDKDGALNSNTKTIRIFVDGTERLSDNSPLDFTSAYASQYGTSLSLNALCETLWRDARTFVDNIKIWNHVASEDPSWEYNAGTGRESAIHEIYGPVNGFKPQTVQSGYYYMPYLD